MTKQNDEKRNEQDDSTYVRDRFEIQDLVHNYCDAICHKNVQAVVDLYTEDGVWEVFGQKNEGKKNLLKAYERVYTKYFMESKQLAHNNTVKIEGDTAYGRWYITEYSRTLKDGHEIFYLGQYDDVYQKTPAGWKFAKRTTTKLHYNERKVTSGRYDGQPMTGPNNVQTKSKL